MKYSGIIDSFNGEYRWLSNFWYHTNNLTVEHMYQASKATNSLDYMRIMSCDSPRTARRIGREILCRYDWEDVKLILMEHFIKEKFLSNPELLQKLKDTNNHLIVEGNTWGDTFWGMCNGEGYNHLGKIIMKVRDEYF